MFFQLNCSCFFVLSLCLPLLQALSCVSAATAPPGGPRRIKVINIAYLQQWLRCSLSHSTRLPLAIVVWQLLLLLSFRSLRHRKLLLSPTLPLADCTNCVLFYRCRCLCLRLCCCFRLCRFYCCFVCWFMCAACVCGRVWAAGRAGNSSCPLSSPSLLLTSRRSRWLPRRRHWVHCVTDGYGDCGYDCVLLRIQIGFSY